MIFRGVNFVTTFITKGIGYTQVKREIISLITNFTNIRLFSKFNSYLYFKTQINNIKEKTTIDTQIKLKTYILQDSDWRS